MPPGFHQRCEGPGAVRTPEPLVARRAPMVGGGKGATDGHGTRAGIYMGGEWVAKGEEESNEVIQQCCGWG